MAAPSAADALQRLYMPHVQSNALALANVKFIASCFAGAVAGVTGLENWAGFALFVVATLATTAFLCVSSYDGRPKKYIQGGLWEIVNPGQENIASFILTWTLFYGIVHVYD